MWLINTDSHCSSSDLKHSATTYTSEFPGLLVAGLSTCTFTHSTSTENNNIKSELSFGTVCPNHNKLAANLKMHDSQQRNTTKNTADNKLMDRSLKTVQKHECRNVWHCGCQKNRSVIKCQTYLFKCATEKIEQTY